jgi:hypothetical protein
VAAQTLETSMTLMPDQITVQAVGGDLIERERTLADQGLTRNVAVAVQPIQSRR